MKKDVGTLRQQTALADTDQPIIISSDDPELSEFLAGRELVVVDFYPVTKVTLKKEPVNRFVIRVKMKD